MKCEKCNKEHDGTFGSGRFCSIFCSNSRTRTKKIREKISISVKNSEKSKRANNNRKVVKLKKCCPICTTVFETYNTERGQKKIYCSRDCYNKDITLEFRKKPLGGYRKGAGNGKSGYYKNIWCDSTYELVYLIWNIDHNIPIQRYSGYFEYNNGKKYYPDFLVNGNIVEVKGYFTELVEEKAKDLDIKILYKEDLWECFEYVKKTYNTTIYYDLYSKYKPTYIYTCSYYLFIYCITIDIIFPKSN